MTAAACGRIFREGEVRTYRASALLFAAALLLPAGAPARADPVTVGIQASFSGPFSIWGKEYREGAELMLGQLGGTAGGHRIRIVYGDDGGDNPQRAQQLAQEMIVRDGAAVIGGSDLTPDTLAVTKIINQAKVPFVIFNTGTASVTDKSPYFVRIAQTNWSTYYPLGVWAAREGHEKRCVAVVADYAPGLDSLAAVKRGFEGNGGTLIGQILVPLSTVDFSAYIQRIRDLSPDCTFIFMPLGPQSATFVKAYTGAGLMKAGVRLLGQSETWEADLPALGDDALGIITAFPYGPNLDNPANRAFVQAFAAKYHAAPTMIAVLGYDGMRVMAKMVEATGGKPDGAAAVAAVKGFAWNSPRGPVSIDPRTRELVQPVYIRQVVKEGGRYVNKVIYTFPDEKEPWHELNR